MSNPSQQPDRSRSKAALVSVSTAIVLIALKSVAVFFTGSLAVLSSLVDSLLDLGASATNFFAIRQAEVPPDKEHRWGHGKAEALSSLAQATFITFSALALGWQSILRLRNPSPIEDTMLGIGVMAFSILASGLLAAFLRRAAKKYNSLALRADSVHYLSDVLTNAAVIFALLAWRFFEVAIVDPLVSLLIVAFLLYTVRELAHEAIDQLMDRELPDDERDNISKIIREASPRVENFHELRTRRSGHMVLIDVHVELPPTITFIEAHEATAAVQHALEDALGSCIGSSLFKKTQLSV